MSNFSSHETISLEKHIETKENITKTPSNDIGNIYEIEKCTRWILDNNYNKICLQFPDYLLPDSVEVVKRIESIIGRKVFILGDTAYESCCIDFVSAQHISADAIIHFGTTCFSKPEEIIPFLKVHVKSPIDVEEFCVGIKNKFTESISILVDTPYLYKLDEIKTYFNGLHTCYSVEDSLTLINNLILYVGENDKKILNLQFSLPSNKFFICNPKESYSICEYVPDSKILKRRYFLSEKIKDSNTIGIIIGTLAVRNYLKVLDRLKLLIKLHSKKYYVISVGKPTVAKLANFPEVDVYVVISCALNEIYENRDFYKPIVTPYDIESALNPQHDSNSSFSYDYNNFLLSNNITDDLKNEIIQNDVSLLTGKIRSSETGEEIDSEFNNQVVIRNEGKIVASTNYGAGFLAGKSWQGLEQNLGEDEPQLAQKGRSGVAYGYVNENK